MRSCERPFLGIDLDNVLALTDSLIRRLIKEMFGVTLEQRNIVYFEYWRCGITQEQDKLVLARFHKTECENVIPIYEAIDVLRSIRDYFEIHIVTGRPAETQKQTLNWLKKHNIPWDRLDFLQEKNQVGVSFKAFIEDRRETAYALATCGTLSFLLDYPWNQTDLSEPANLIRVKSWKEIRQYLEKLLII